MTFPTDPETLDLLDAGIRNPGGERSNLFGTLEFLSNGTLDPHAHNDRCVQLGENVWDCTEGTEPQWTPNCVILALIDEVRTLRERLDA